MKFNFILLLCSLAGFLAQAQDQIFRKDNTKVDAKVLEVTKTEVRYKLFSYPDGPTISIAASDVSAIIYQDGRHEVLDKAPRAAKNAIFFEMLGNGGLYSFNYDRILFKRNRFSMAGRIGFSYLPEDFIGNKFPVEISNASMTCIPVELSALYGGASKLEVGIGYTPVIRTTSGNLYDFYNVMSASVGYRYQKPGQGFFFKAGLMYAKSLDRYLGGAFPFVNFGFGYSF